MKHTCVHLDNNSMYVANSGDTDRYNTKLPNKVYNKLRVHAVTESKRAARLHEKKDQSTATQAVDQRTRLLLFKMLNEGLLTEVHGVISAGMLCIPYRKNNFFGI